MAKQLMVSDEILIDAAPEKVWEILIDAKYVAQWDELPEDYPLGKMDEGSRVIWELPNGGQSITTIIAAIPKKELKIALYVSNWEEKPKEGDVAYLYQLEEQGSRTLLKIRIGDFSLIKNGQNYYEASAEFAENAKMAIKKLAEG
ncbi:SRPBCC domain-containing protein [Bacillus sp. F19]|nr:SRPBCC domain-containing protein [Bacillus sp. F19]